MPTLQDLRAEMRALDLLSGLAPNPGEYDRVLAQREEPAFDAEWLRVYAAVQDLEVEGEIQKTNVVIDELSESAYRRVQQLTGNAELAGAVSDDFDLIARAIQVGYADEFLDELWEEYEAGRLPS